MAPMTSLEFAPAPARTGRVPADLTLRQCLFEASMLQGKPRRLDTFQFAVRKPSKADVADVGAYQITAIVVFQFNDAAAGLVIGSQYGTGVLLC